jgi:hypothetical protein
MTQQDPAKLKKVSVNLFGIGSAEWQDDPTQRKAAWSLYVELITRVAIQPLNDDQGLLREALTSLYKLFDITRQILREAGPDVGASKNSIGGYAIDVLNKGLRPFLSKWHPLLQSWEAKREPSISPKEHEKNWELEPKLRQELHELTEQLNVYAEQLAEFTGNKNNGNLL